MFIVILHRIPNCGYGIIVLFVWLYLVHWLAHRILLPLVLAKLALQILAVGMDIDFLTLQHIYARYHIRLYCTAYVVIRIPHLSNSVGLCTIGDNVHRLANP